MSDKKAKYITTTLPYVNNSPHLGHALEFVHADTIARYYRILGHEVFFNTGVDEHGQKIAQKADEAGIDRQAYVDKYAAEFDNLKTALNLSYDSFIRTTSEKHKLAAREVWQRCEVNGDIYKKTYKGLYCVGCEAFKTESDLIDGKCPDHLTVPEEIEEENYFFRLSKYQTYLEEYLSNDKSTLPNFRRLELLNFVQGGLEDLSISRQKSRMDWGIEVPNDNNHVMYVWFDALTNYVSCLDWPNDEEGKYTKFWQDGETLQLAGKDQLRFQSVIWQAMLKSAGLPATKTIFYHGFINSGGQKMSKSLGNVISPYEMIERYGTDATRYILLRHVHPFDDSDVTWEKMDEWYTANLVNGIGNLVARVMKMAETHLESPVEFNSTFADIINYSDDVLLKIPVGNLVLRYKQDLEQFQYQSTLDFVWGYIQMADQKITETEPFKLVKTDKESALKIIKDLLVEIYRIGFLLKPFLPATSEIILDAIKNNKKPDNLFKRLEG